MFDIFAKIHVFIVRFLRIHPVQRVVNNITQLFGRGFSGIFYMKLFVSQLYVFLVLQNERRTVQIDNKKQQRTVVKKTTRTLNF